MCTRLGTLTMLWWRKWCRSYSRCRIFALVFAVFYVLHLCQLYSVRKEITQLLIVFLLIHLV